MYNKYNKTRIGILGGSFNPPHTVSTSEAPVRNKHKKRIGILGGSFNPPHAGHLHIALMAQKYCHCDHIIWLINHDNPIKKNHDYYTMDQRIGACLALTIGHRHSMSVLPQSALCASPFAIDVVKKLPHHAFEFLWVGGSDLLGQFTQWQHWQKLLRTLPFCLFARHNNDMKTNIQHIKILSLKQPLPYNMPLLINKIYYFHTPMIMQSSSKIRGDHV